MADEERAAACAASLIDAALSLCRAEDVALRHLARELEPIIQGVEDWIEDGDYCLEDDWDVDTSQAWS